MNPRHALPAALAAAGLLLGSCTLLDVDTRRTETVKPADEARELAALRARVEVLERRLERLEERLAR